jgi:hypothetical protein
MANASLESVPDCTGAAGAFSGLPQPGARADTYSRTLHFLLFFPGAFGRALSLPRPRENGLARFPGSRRYLVPYRKGT